LYEGKIMRVYELAKEFGKVSTEFLDEIQGYGIDVKSHLATLDDVQIATIRQNIADGVELEKFVPPPDIVDPIPEEKDISDRLGNLVQSEIDKAFAVKQVEEDPDLDDLRKEFIGERAEDFQEKMDLDDPILKEKEKREKMASDIKGHAEAHRREQLKSVSKPKGLFGWIASLFS
tara:strand:- start:1512 stop:2036 length:525 start_codon:yes stop_codon:yes gene_type:complete